jgi:hypothetical protein
MANEFDLPSAKQRSLEEKIADAWTDFYYGTGFGDVYIPKENDRWNALCDLLEDLRERVEANRCSDPVAA